MVSYPFVYATEEIADCIEWIKDYSEGLDLNAVPNLKLGER